MSPPRRNIGEQTQMKYIGSRDWSYGLLMDESRLGHEVSKIVGAESAEFLIGVGMAKAFLVVKKGKNAKQLAGCLQDAGEELGEQLVKTADDVADIGKGSLRKRMGDPPSHMKKPQAHHDLANEFADKFRKAGFDINDPRYGRWVEGGPVGNHQKWSKAFNDEWAKFFTNNPEPTQKQILAKFAELRKNPKFK